MILCLRSPKNFQVVSLTACFLVRYDYTVQTRQRCYRVVKCFFYRLCELMMPCELMLLTVQTRLTILR